MMRAVSLEKKASEDLWLLDSFSSSPLSSPCNLKSFPKGWGKNVPKNSDCKDFAFPCELCDIFLRLGYSAFLTETALIKVRCHPITHDMQSSLLT